MFSVREVFANFEGSLSARRAWIEIMEDLLPSTTRRLSLSARRAWIEIHQLTHHQSANRVALRKESVDRNIRLDVSYNIKESRSPQGERG